MSRGEYHLAQLLGEIELLRRRLSELESTEARLRATEADLRRQSQRTELINSLLVYLNGCANESEMHGPILETALSLSGMESGCLLMREGETLRLACQRRLAENLSRVLTASTWGIDATSRFGARTRYMALPEFDGAMAAAFGTAGLTNVYVVPLNAGSTLLGLAIVGNSSTETPVRANLVPMASVLGMASDVLQRRRAEQQLARGEAQTRAIVEASPDMLVRLDENGLYLDFQINKRHPLYPPYQDLRGRSLAAVIGERNGARFLAGVRRVVETGEMEALDYEVRTRLGRREFEARLVALPGREVLALVRDVTDERRTARVERVLLEIADATNRTEDLRGLCAGIRESLARVLDATNFHIMVRDPVTGRLSVIFDTDEYDHDVRFDPQDLEHGLGAYVMRMGRTLRITGEMLGELGKQGEADRVGTSCKCWIGAPLFDDGRVFGIVAVQSYRDTDAFDERDVELLSFVSGQIAAAVLRKRREVETLRLYSAVECIAESIDILDTEGIIQYVNPGFEQTTGYLRGEVIGNTLKIVKSELHPDEFFADMWATMKRGEIWTGRIVNRRKNGDLWEEEVTISPVKDKSGSIVSYVEVRRPTALHAQSRGSSDAAVALPAVTPRPIHST